MTVYTRVSELSGRTNTMDLPITEIEYAAWQASGVHVQSYFPQLTPDQREFLLTGASQEEWDELFGDDPEEEDEDR